ncbi:MAG: peroxiredoxin family protein [Pseudomonadota bacterium]
MLYNIHERCSLSVALPASGGGMLRVLLLVLALCCSLPASTDAQAAAAGSTTDVRYADSWGPEVGTPVPLLAANDQSGRPRALGDLTGERGLLLFLVRSADWCPFCKRQLLQLKDYTAEFAALGVNVAAMSYDSLEILDGFYRSYELPYPLLRDVDQQHVKAYGVLNERYKPGHRAYGIPHPGALLIEPDGRLKAKFAVPGFRQRPPFDAMLATLTELMAMP